MSHQSLISRKMVEELPLSGISSPAGDENEIFFDSRANTDRVLSRHLPTKRCPGKPLTDKVIRLWMHWQTPRKCLGLSRGV